VRAQTCEAAIQSLRSYYRVATLRRGPRSSRKLPPLRLDDGRNNGYHEKTFNAERIPLGRYDVPRSLRATRLEVDEQSGFRFHNLYLFHNFLYPAGLARLLNLTASVSMCAEHWWVRNIQRYMEFHCDTELYSYDSLLLLFT
jgi:hypothetical protein